MFSLRPHLRVFRTLQRPLRPLSTYVAPEDLQYPDLPDRSHYDLASFLEYASRAQVDTTSPTYIGTHYEYTVQSALERLGMTLRRVGGRADNGIDLLGTWSLPSVINPIKVIVQCKAYAIHPSQARELEGAFVGAPQGWRGTNVLALLVSQKVATKGVREALGRSRWPMGYVFCQPCGKISQILWNKRAEEEGLAGIEVGVKYEGGDTAKKRIVLTWKGNLINR
jgi:hypothetical protein